jgi:hypothetical protein
LEEYQEELLRSTVKFLEEGIKIYSPGEVSIFKFREFYDIFYGLFHFWRKFVQPDLKNQILKEQ